MQADYFEPLTVVAVCLLAFICYMGLFLFIGWWFRRKPKICKSPYTGLPLRRADRLPHPTMKKVALFLNDFHQYDNRVFSFKKAALCRETGRLFQDCVNWRGKIKVDWSFIQKRAPGNYISWGSLSNELKETIAGRHDFLDAFQTYRSSTNPSPRNVEPKYAASKPGPLYVDIETGVLVGWQQVPDTDLEVLIVQRPVR